MPHIPSFNFSPNEINFPCSSILILVSTRMRNPTERNIANSSPPDMRLSISPDLIKSAILFIMILV